MKAPLVHLLTETAPKLTTWCTPSILLDAPRVTDVYRVDTSISYDQYGSPLEPPWDSSSGVFGEACTLAARAYHAHSPEDPGYCLFSVNGTSGANFMVLKALKYQLGGAAHMLTERNIHKSIAHACEDYRIRLTFLEPHYHPAYRIFIPGTREAYIEALAADPSINSVLITNPTYEGFSVDLPELISAIRAYREDLIIFVDEAWGSNFQFHSQQPPTAMDSGADIAVVSTHKQGGALQQTSIILCKERRLNRDLVFYAYRSLLTTSPSWHLLASIDGARAYLEAHGREAIEQEFQIATYLEAALALWLSRITTAQLQQSHPHGVRYMDATKLLFGFREPGLSGHQLVQEVLTPNNIVIEAHTDDVLLFVVPFQNTLEQAQYTAAIIQTGIAAMPHTPRSMVPMPAIPTRITKVKEIYETGRLVSKTLNNGITGQICAESIVPYPPGIPLIVKGERLEPEHIAYIRALQQRGKRIMMWDRDYILIELL